MEYRYLTKDKVKISILGFGCMRLPEKNGEIDRGTASDILDYAADNGVNYLDTGWEYHDFESENFLGQYLSFGSRKDKFFVATKMPVWELNNSRDADRFFFEQLKKLRVKKLSFYLLHSLNKDTWEQAKKAGIIEWIEDKKRHGLIDYIGFSFHDDLNTFKNIVSDYDGWDFCQIQYNYINTNYQAGSEGLSVARKNGIGVIVMEPLLGGSLAVLPNRVDRVWKRFKRADFLKKDIVSVSPVDLSLRWVWGQDVSLLLSGMSSMSQVEQNIKSANEFNKRGGITQSESHLILKIKDEFSKTGGIPCTGCKYCQSVCRQDIDISNIFYLYNLSKIFNQHEKARSLYLSAIASNSNKCIGCLACEKKCPQKINISQELAKANNHFR